MIGQCAEQQLCNIEAHQSEYQDITHVFDNVTRAMDFNANKKALQKSQKDGVAQRNSVQAAARHSDYERSALHV